MEFDFSHYFRRTPLLLAAEYDQPGIVEYLIQSGADMSSAREDTLTALHVAAINGHVSAMSVLLKNGAKIECKTVDE